jgi:hypothetical protein
VYFKLDSTDLFLTSLLLSTVGRTSYIYRPFRPIALGLYRPIAIGFISLNHRLRKPEIIGFVSLIDHYDIQFKVVGIGPTYLTYPHFNSPLPKYCRCPLALYSRLISP